MNSRSQSENKRFFTSNMAQFQAIWLASPSAMVLSDDTGTVLETNPAYEALCGFSREELIGHHFSIVFPKEAQEKASEEYQEAFNRPGMPPPQKIVVQRLDGTMREVESQMSFLEEGGQRIAMLSTMRDITEHKQLKETLHPNEAKWRSLVTNAPDTIFTVDRDRKITFINRTPAGITPEEALGTDVCEYVAPEYRSTVESSIKGVFKTGQPDSYIIVARGDYDTASWFSTTLGPVVEEGIVTAVALITRDISQQMHAELARQESTARWESLVANAPYFIAVLDLDGRFQYLNHLQPGFDMETVLQSTTYDHIDPQYHDMVRNKIKQVVDTRQPASYEVQAFGEKGEIFWYETRVSPLIIDDEVVSVTMISADISERKRSEINLQHANDNLKAAQRIGRVGSWEWHLQTKQSNWSDEMYRIYGRDQALGTPPMKGWLDHYHPEDRDRLQAALQDAIAGNRRYEIEYRIFRESDGEERVIHSIGEIIRDKDNQPMRIIGTAQDVTETKQAHAELARLAAIVNSSEEAMMSISLDNRFMTWNAAAEKMYGYTAAEVIGQPVNILIPPHLHEEAVTIPQKVRSGKVLINYETTRLRKDGTAFPVSLTASPILNEQGEVVAISSISRDITKRIENDRRLQVNEANLRALIEASDESVLLIEPDGVIVECNERVGQRLGHKRNEMIGLNAYDLLETAVAQSRRAHVAQVMKTGAPTRFVDERLGRIVHNSIYPVKDEQGEVVRLALFGRDITEQEKTAKDLVTSEEQYRQLVNHAPVGIFTVQNGRYTFANPAGLKMLGYESLDVLKKAPVLDTIAPETREIVNQRINQIAHNKSNKTVELKIERKDGSFIISESTSLPILFGDEPAALIIGHDITEKREIEQSLLENEKRLGILFDNAQDNILIHSLDENDMPLSYISVNESACHTLGYSREELLAMSPLDTNSPNMTLDMEPIIRQLLEEGNVTFEALGQHKDGHDIPFEVNAHLLQIGTERLVMSISRDITERKKAEETQRSLLSQIQNQAQRTQRIIETVPEGMLVLDNNYTIVSANQMALKHLAAIPQAELGKKLVELGDQPIAVFLEPPPQGQWHEFEINDCIFEVRARPLIIQGHNEGWVLALNNVTDARHTLTAMRHQERLASVGQLAAGMAHDFNNILAVISLYVEVSLSEIYHSPALRQRLKIINDQTEKAANLIQQILDFGRSSMLQPQPIDFSTLLTNQISLLQRTLPENITIDATYDLGQLIIEADPTRMQQVIMNLAINARNAMPNGGNLHFSLTEFQVDAYYTPHKAVDLPHGLWIALEVKDTGIGIAPEIIDRIFEPFFTTLEPGQGSGLGLAQVYGIVKQHGGDIHVDSSPGQGTVFTIYLPATESDESADEIHPDAIPRGHQERVLIVEDDEMVRIVLDESLTTLNYEVITAVNGQEALQLYQQQDNPIDLVLSDMIMPEMNGDVLFFELKKLDTAVKMVIITGYAQAERLTEMQHQGLKGWLYKPPNLEELATLVANALA